MGDLREGETRIFLCKPEMFWLFKLQDWDFKVFLMQVQEAQILRCSDVIYKNEQRNWDFKTFLVLQKSRLWDAHSLLKKQTARPLKFNGNFARPMVFWRTIRHPSYCHMIIYIHHMFFLKTDQQPVSLYDIIFAGVGQLLWQGVRSCSWFIERRFFKHCPAHKRSLWGELVIEYDVCWLMPATESKASILENRLLNNLSPPKRPLSCCLSRSSWQCSVPPP